MNTTELAEELANEMDLPKAACRKMVSFLFARIAQEIGVGGNVKITGFGTFFRSKRKARIGRNPQNGTPVEIPAKRIPRFKAGKGLREEAE